MYTMYIVQLVNALSMASNTDYEGLARCYFWKTQTRRRRRRKNYNNYKKNKEKIAENTSFFCDQYVGKIIFLSKESLWVSSRPDDPSGQPEADTA